VKSTKKPTKKAVKPVAETPETTASVEVNGEQHPLESPEAKQHIAGVINAESTQTNLADLMDAFDNSGVSIEETQWRALSAEEQGVATRWVNNRRIGPLSPVPFFLMPFATQALKNEYSAYAAEQKEVRRVIMSCSFGKPSPTQPDGDDGEAMIKMTLNIPVNDLSASTANDLWGWKRDLIEFGYRDVSKWDERDLPGMDRIIKCSSDVSGFSRNRKHWKFSFLVSQNELGIEEAFSMWKTHGSCRIENIGEPIKTNRDESENPELEHDGEDEPDEVRKPVRSLFDPQK
jgi:hypothetical protein